MGRLEGKVAVITAATSGMALATAKLFVEEGAHVFITGRRQDKLADSVKTIGRNGTGVQGDAANLDDLDRLYDAVKREKVRIDILFASAGRGEFTKIGSGPDRYAGPGSARPGGERVLQNSYSTRRNGATGGNCDGRALPGFERFEFCEWCGAFRRRGYSAGLVTKPFA